MINRGNFLFTVLGFILGFSVLAQRKIAAHQPGLNVSTEDGIERMHRAYIAQNKTSPSLMGYRVQIYNGRKAETLKKRSEFLSVFPSMEPYTLYDAPEYKLQVGNFRTRLEAEKFLKRVQEEFGSGFVVRTQIKMPKLEYALPERKR